MVNDYICRENMLNAVEKLDIIPSVDGMGIPTGAEDFRVQFLGTVLKVEPADVAPVMHGEWIYDGHHRRCNRCGTYFCNTDREGDTIPNNFCPNCGARMIHREE